MKKLLLLATLLLSATLLGFEDNTQEAEEDLAIQSTEVNKPENSATKEMEREESEESEEKNLMQEENAPQTAKPVPEFKGRPLAF